MNLILFSQTIGSIVVSAISIVVVIVVFAIVYIFYTANKNRNSTKVVNEVLESISKEENNIIMNISNADLIKEKEINIELFLSDTEPLLLNNHSIENKRVTKGLIIFENILDGKKANYKQETTNGLLKITSEKLIIKSDKVNVTFLLKQIAFFGMIYSLTTKTILLKPYLYNSDQNNNIFFTVPSLEDLIFLDQYIVNLRIK